MPEINKFYESSEKRNYPNGEFKKYFIEETEKGQSGKANQYLPAIFMRKWYLRGWTYNLVSATDNREEKVSWEEQTS